MQAFIAKIHIIGINPYVLLPAAIRKQLFKEAGKDRGPIAVKGTINNHAFIQTMVKYNGKWRLYINAPMLKGGCCQLGDNVNITIAFDGADRITAMHPQLETALQKNKAANSIFMQLPPSRQKEIMRYINNLKTPESIERNIDKAIDFLLGRARFIGREKPW